MKIKNKTFYILISVYIVILLFLTSNLNSYNKGYDDCKKWNYSTIYKEKLIIDSCANNSLLIGTIEIDEKKFRKDEVIETIKEKGLKEIK